MRGPARRRPIGVYILMGLGGVALFAALIALFGWVVMLLWNALMPAIFPGLAAIAFWQAIGLVILARILFGRFGGRSGRWGGWRGRHRGGHGHGPWGGGHRREYWQRWRSWWEAEGRESFEDWRARQAAPASTPEAEDAPQPK